MSEVNPRRPSGHYETTGFWGERASGATLSCVHCGGAWVARKGSGKVRGFCQNCNGYVCGPACAECVPVEQFLENAEAGRPADHKPIRVWVPPGIDDLTG